MVDSKYQPTKEEARFLKYYDALIKETIYARSHFKIWEQIIDNAKDYLDELNIAPLFFRFTIKSHLDSTILTLSRILDEDGKSLSIWKFLNYVEQNRYIFSTQSFRQRIKNDDDYEYSLRTHIQIELKDIENDRKELNNLKSGINLIKKWRDKKLAHFDLKSYINDEKLSIQRKQIEIIIDVFDNILNRYSNAYNQSGWLLRTVGDNDFKNILDAIRFSKIERKKQYEVIKNQYKDYS